ncbi:TspO/MBR family protein [Flavisolibacter ginsenosidimutans]|uniref:TspO/MBR family protein n=1 Tax=Flavisolibacter ginsenosidimutans TaxID=661481 RepID=UPI001D14AFA2|nr:TspO/MBR family protein [Flavisolibacter ginsenosidimutans]
MALPLSVGGIAALFTQAGIDRWFTTIQKPAWQPPNWLFAPVWTVLYILMGIALYLVWKQNAPGKRGAIILWSLQLVLNFLWSFIFFSQHRIALALVDIVVLWLLILLTIFSFAKFSKTAAWLLVPYISWVSFAATLNFAIYQLNR